MNMKKISKGTGPLFRWGRVLALSAPLLISCAQSAGAQGSNSESAATGALAASSAAGAEEGAHKEADMKEVILNVFGMT